MNKTEASLANIEPATPSVRQEPSRSSSIPWSSLGKAAAAAFASMATAFNFIGQEAYDRYLGHWGFDGGSLPLETSMRFHYGYMAVFESMHSLLTSQFGKLLLLALFIVIGIQVWVTALARKSPPGSTKPGRWLKRAVERLPQGVESFLASFGLSGVIVALLYYMAFAAFIGLAIAPMLGEHAAGKWAQNKEERIKQGCQRTSAHGVCTELSRDGKLVGRGFIIASSTTRIAYFDVTAQRGRLVKAEDIELVGWMP